MTEDPWAEYARLQGVLERTANTQSAAGIEAAMCEILDRMARGESCTAEQCKNLVVNRTNRERRRRAMLYQSAQAIDGSTVGISAVENRVLLAECEAICGPVDFNLLVDRASGFSFGELAVVTGLSENALKVRVHRARKKILPLAA